jgi:hypothetical protein
LQENLKPDNELKLLVLQSASVPRGRHYQEGRRILETANDSFNAKMIKPLPRHCTTATITKDQVPPLEQWWKLLEGEDNNVAKRRRGAGTAGSGDTSPH